MGERLGIGIYKNKKLLAAAYYHWSGYADAALGLLEEDVIPFLRAEPISKYKDDTLYAIRALEETGAALVDDDLETAQKLYPEEKFAEFKDRNEGWIGLGDEAAHIMRATNECVEIDLDKEEFYFGSIGYYNVAENMEGNYVPIGYDEAELTEAVERTIKDRKTIKVHRNIDPEHVRFDQVEELEYLLDEVGYDFFTIDSKPGHLFYAM